MKPRIGSLCSGAGGLDLAVEGVFGGETAWHVEYDAAASKVLEARWPGVPNLGDIKEIDWDEMGRTPNWEKSQRLYDRYCQGLSLAEVAAEEGISRQSVFTMFKRRGFDCRPRPPARPELVYRGVKYTLRNNGYYGSTTGERTLMHRDIWEAERGPIPEGFEIHHIDHDKSNNVIDNFECLSKSDHARLYNIGCNQAQHRCRGGGAPDSFAVDIVTAGYP